MERALLFQTIPPADPINKYRVVQTGPKIQFGGLKVGLFKPSYQAPGIA